MRRKGKGFTLIEILVVIFIIAVISIFILVNTANSRARARDKRRQTDITALATAFENYFAQNKNYPVHNPPTINLGTIRVNQGYLINTNNFNNYIKEYVSEIPIDPNLGENSPGSVSIKYGYYYDSVSCSPSYTAGQKYYVNAIVENEESSNSDGLGRKENKNRYYELGNLCFQRNSGDCQCSP